LTSDLNNDYDNIRSQANLLVLMPQLIPRVFHNSNKKGKRHSMN